MRRVTLLASSLLIVWILFNSILVLAKEEICDNRFVTLVNPVRGRDLWIDKYTNPIKTQINLIKQYNFPATWLLQYDVLKDSELVGEIKKFDSKQELGVLLEVSANFAEDARIIYPFGKPWFNPSVVFLSGYSQSERRKLIDKLLQRFGNEFGYYPKSVGAWWIDSFSLNYLKEKYGISAAMIVADQKTTDNYGVWGQWWGVPYYPSSANILMPASSLLNKQDVVIIQWAQRDPILAYGEGPRYSNYSLQANDYIRQGKDTKYFGDLASVYLNCKNKIGQITIGLETGIESVGYINEYENQLKYLSEIPNLNFVTMSQFASSFSKIYPQFPEQSILSYKDSTWLLKTNSRNNAKSGDNIKYNQSISFKDFFIADHQNFLERNLEKLNYRSSLLYFPYFLVLILIACLFSLTKKIFRLWVIGTLFSVCAFGLVLKSNYQFGWQVFYGVKVPFLIYTQVVLIIVAYFLIWLISKLSLFKKNNFILWFIPLSFGIDHLAQNIRLSLISGRYYFGFAIDSLRFFGFSFEKPLNLTFVNKDFPSFLASALLRFDYNKIWDNLYLSLLIYPLVHIMLGIALGYFFIKLPRRVIGFTIGVFVILTIFYLINIFQSDPRLVQ